MKYGKDRDKKDWVKLHCCVGVKTETITSFEISQKGDAGMFKPLFESTKKNGFHVKRVFADKAYSSRNNLKLVVENYAEPYIRFKDKRSCQTLSP